MLDSCDVVTFLPIVLKGTVKVSVVADTHTHTHTWPLMLYFLISYLREATLLAMNLTLKNSALLVGG